LLLFIYISAGACGYGEFGRLMDGYGGRVTGVSGLWRNGAGCGTCYQVPTFLSFNSFQQFLYYLGKCLMIQKPI